MTSDEIKSAVRSYYETIAVEGGSCCSSGCGCGTVENEALITPMSGSYSESDPTIVETADLGLGCGFPTGAADLRQGMIVLDLGSGAGIDLFLAAKEVGPTGKAIGVDMSEAMVERAERNRLRLGITNAEFRLGEIEALPVESDSVDRIISNCVLNLVPDKRKAFSEMHRVLKPGGSFTVSDIVVEGTIPAEYRSDPQIWSGCVSGAEEKQVYVGMLRNTGFRDVTIVTENASPAQEEIPFRLVSITVKGSK
jgi:SAM-dependent methyltransferase